MSAEVRAARFGHTEPTPLKTADGLSGKIQQHQEIPYSDKVRNLKGRAIYGAINALNSWLIRPSVENIMVKIDIEYAPNFGDQYIRALQDGYARPLVAGNHRRIVDALFPRDPVRDLVNVANEFLPEGERLKGLAELLAASLHYGYQGPMRKALYNGLLPSIEKGGMNPFLTVRPQDVRRYKMREYFNPEQEHQDLVRIIKDGFGVFILPEGTTVGNEMNPFMQTALFGTMAAIEEAEEKALVIPLSVTGGDKIQQNNKLPTLMSVKSGLNINNDHFIRVYVGAPMRYDKGVFGDLYKTGNKTGINDLIGGLIASHLPESERGAYREQAKAA